ncbi:capsular polysaccharide biosynthesis protein [Burkholderia aenigmatica]|uniref:capsule biosynthesis protein n=1 Tax=Burkholderia aenigmatica TaxID=2015348 RepID=UPI0014532185|nr:capsular biosynthesis protein [Burkholderia aenigmatica]VWC68983.1 capsular polysaccharide biosynthesis protein [Burkholderia aenigmatica]
MSRSFLALQGTASPFFSQLAHVLGSRGHRVTRVNFCGGDLAYAGGGAAWNYRDKAEGLSAWYRQIVEANDFTDVFLFGDCREIHRPIHAVVQDLGLRVHVFEEGYVRPHWITMEHHGVNGRSLLPRDPDWYRDQRKHVPPAAFGHPTGYNLKVRVYHDIAYRLANALHARRFPYYRSHRPKNGFQEYAGLAYRAAQSRVHAWEADRIARELLDEKREYYLFPLQLNSDAQIVAHSPFDGICAAISAVLRSFARYAPSRAWLVIKNHPLDTGLIAYKQFAAALARELGIDQRMLFIDAGHLPTLLDHSRGVVVVNSTVGLSALHHERPLIALGTAIYAIPGLTWQGSLDDFWTQADSPDMHLYRAFLDYVMHHTQINGDFYTKSGIEMAVAGVVARVEEVHG